MEAAVPPQHHLQDAQPQCQARDFSAPQPRNSKVKLQQSE